MTKQDRVKVLIVEDEVYFALSLEADLKSAGFDVADIIATGDIAINKIIEMQPDVVLMDIQLAGDVSGIQVASKIRETSNVPIVFMTGYADSGIMEIVRSFNSSVFIVKPVIIKKLIEIINSILPRIETEM